MKTPAWSYSPPKGFTPYKKPDGSFSLKGSCTYSRERVVLSYTDASGRYYVRWFSVSGLPGLFLHDEIRDFLVDCGLPEWYVQAIKYDTNVAIPSNWIDKGKPKEMIRQMAKRQILQSIKDLKTALIRYIRGR